MKSRTLTCITAMALFAALAVPVWLSGQEQDDKPKHRHYKLMTHPNSEPKHSFEDRTSKRPQIET